MKCEKVSILIFVFVLFFVQIKTFDENYEEYYDEEDENVTNTAKTTITSTTVPTNPSSTKTPKPASRATTTTTSSTTTTSARYTGTKASAKPTSGRLDSVSGEGLGEVSGNGPENRGIEYSIEHGLGGRKEAPNLSARSYLEDEERRLGNERGVKCLLESEIIARLLNQNNELASALKDSLQKRRRNRKKTTTPSTTTTTPPPTTTTTTRENLFSIQDAEFEDEWFEESPGTETTTRTERDHPNPYGPVRILIKFLFLLYYESDNVICKQKNL